MDFLQMENALSRWFHLQQQAELWRGRYEKEMDLSICLTPAYKMEEDGRNGYISCDTFTCHFANRNGKGNCQVRMKRLEAAVEATGTGCRIRRIRWYLIQEMKPWTYPKEIDFCALPKYPELPKAGTSVEVKKQNCEEDRMAIRNLMNMFFEHRLERMHELFFEDKQTNVRIDLLSKRTVKGYQAITKWFQETLAGEKENAHCYRFLGLNCAPVIEIDESRRMACSLSMAETFRIDAKDKEPARWTLIRRLCTVCGRYVNTVDGWKISHLHIQKLIDLPIVRYRNDQRYDKAGQSKEPWSVDQKYGGTISVSDAMQIENIINGWAYSCRQGTLDAFCRNYFFHPDFPVSMLIRSFGTKTEELRTFEDIMTKIRDMVAQYRNRYYTWHAPTTPVLQYDGDKEHVVATWYDRGTTNLRSMSKSAADILYMVFVNKYTHHFRRAGGKWYIERFYNEPVISMPDWHFDMMHSRGYVSIPDTPCFPDRFELLTEEEKEGE